MQDLGSGTFEGYVVGDSGAVFKITDVSGTVSIVALSASLSKMYTSITYNGSDFYAAGRDTSGEGFICTISGTTITDVSNLSTTAMRSVCFVSNDALYPGYAFAVGDDGHLLKSLDGGSTWKEVKTGLTKNFANVYFRTDLIGLALIDSADGNNQMFKTADGGLSWTLMGSKGEYYHSMHFESDETGIAVGKNGLIKRIIVNSNGYEPYFGLIAVREPENPATKQEYTAVSSTMVPLSSTDTAIFACVVRADGKFFGTKDLGAGTVQWRDLDVITPTDLPVRQIGLKIEKETISSQDYYLFRVPFATSLNYPLALIEKVVSGTVNASTVDVPFTFGVRKLYNITNSPLTNEIYALGRINIAGGSNIQLYRIEMSDVPTIPTLSCTPKSTGSSTFDGINEPTCLAIDSSDNVLVSSADLHTILTKSDAPIGTSPISFTDKSWTVTPLAITDIESYGSSNHMVASGEDGTMYSTYSITSGLGFSADLSYCSAKLNAIRMDGSGDGIVAGDSGKVFRFVHTTGLFELDPVMSGTIKNLNDIAFTTGSAISYISGDAGTLLKIPVTGSVDRVHSLMPSPLNVNYYGLTFKSGSSTELQVVGTHSGIYYYTGSNGMKVKDVFVHGLQDVNFRNSNEGFAVGEDGIIRHTINAGSTWDVILPEFNSSDELPEYKSVWNTGPEQLVLAGSGNYLSQIENGALNAFATHDYSSSNSNVWNDIKFNEHAVGFSVCSDGDALEFSYSESTNAVSIVGTHSDSASISFNALHIFDDNSFIAVGPSNTIRYYNGSGFINQKGNITASGNNYNDVFFHDDRNGYVVGDGGMIYRTSALCNIQGLGGNGLKWYKRTDEDQFVIRDVDTADVDIKVIAFPGRYNGWVAGSYSRNNESYRGTTYPYGRLLHDESLLYSTTFWYDRVGRLVLSQNTKQYNVTPKRFSYTLYDKLGRIHEVGEKDENVSNIFFPEIFGEYVNNYFNPKVLNDSSMSVWIGETSGARREVTKTFYDVPSIPVYPYLCDQSTTYSFDQENLRNRVASVTYQEIYDEDSTIFDYGTHYSYDIHGNVKSLLQDNQKFSLDYSMDQQRFKKIDYDYDLISGKVNSVTMQKDQPDQYIHEYQYDADNRITHVYTSKDGVQFDNDASYFYYLHGPLARMELGNDKVQGVDYAYTLQGWIKGVNSNLGSPGNDIGMDGNSGTSNEFVARDAYGYTLNYYEGDYEPINTHRSIPADSSFEMKTAGSDVWANRSDLFNGNISMMATTIAEPISSNNQVLAPLPQANAYRYDQLNRLLESRSFDNFNSSTNTWGSGSSYADRYFNQFSYDANGNIINQLRDSLTGDKIDEFHYLYDSATTCGNTSTYRKINNRLMHVVNTASGSPVTMNFEYDDIGNLVSDSEAEIDTIYWTVSGKIKQIMRQSGSTMQGLIFEYDPMGNRIAKHVYNASGPLEYSTYYLRDAQGNILATYQFTDTSGVPSFTLREENLYGSSRLGIRKDSIELIGATSVCNLGTSTNLLGLKQFELSNHLGNVLSVVSDRKLPYNSSGTGSITSYQPEILNATDYYPFGMGMGGRDFSSGNDYRFGFNNMEAVKETANSSYIFEYGKRNYSSRFCKFISVDPLAKYYPWWTPYQFAGNSVIRSLDLDGLEILDYCAFFIAKVNKTALSTDFVADPVPSCFPNYFNKDLTSIAGISPFIIASVVRKDFSAIANRNIPMNSTERTLSQNSTSEGFETPEMPEPDPYTLEKFNIVKEKTGTIVDAIHSTSKYLLEKSDEDIMNAYSDLAMNTYAFNAAYNLVSKYLGNQDEANIKKVTSQFKIDVDQLKVDLINWVVDGTKPNSPDETYKSFIESKAKKILSYDSTVPEQVSKKSE